MVSHYSLKNRDGMKELAAAWDGQPVTIVTTGKEPITVIREETNGAVVTAAIDKLAVSFEHEYMGRAIEFTQSLTVGSGADIHIYTDSFDRSAIPEGDGKLSWTVNGSKDPAVNVSIDKFGAVQSSDGIEAIVKIVNQSQNDMTGDVRIIDALTGVILAEETFEIEGEKDQLLSFKKLPESKAIRAEINANDDYEADNTAFVLLGNETKEAIVDGKLHELVKKAFEAVGLFVATGSVNEMIAAQDDSIVVTNDVSFLETGTKPIILIGRNDRTTEPVADAIISTADPLFSIVDISDVYVSAVYPPIEGFTTIASIGDKPFIQKSSRGDIAILADIEMTDWPLHPSFPLFIWSSAELLRSEADILGTFVPNERKAVISGEIEVYTEADEYVTTIADGSSFIAPSLPGIYKAREGDAEKLFSVQLEETEKEIAVGTSFRISKTESDGSVETGKKMVGILFLPLLILLVMLIEWEVQRRRGYPN